MGGLEKFYALPGGDVLGVVTTTVSRSDVARFFESIRSSLSPLLVADGILKTDLAVGLLHFLDAPNSSLSQIRVDVYTGGQNIPIRFWSTDSLNSRCPIRLPRAPSLPSSTSEDPGQVFVGVRCPGSQSRNGGLFDNSFLVEQLSLDSGRSTWSHTAVVHPDGVPVSFFIHRQIPPKSVAASAHIPLWRGNTGFFRKQRQSQV